MTIFDCLAAMQQRSDSIEDQISELRRAQKVLEAMLAVLEQQQQAQTPAERIRNRPKIRSAPSR